MAQAGPPAGSPAPTVLILLNLPEGATAQLVQRLFGPAYTSPTTTTRTTHPEHKQTKK